MSDENTTPEGVTEETSDVAADTGAEDTPAEEATEGEGE